MPISRVRELTAANMVLAAANMAPMLRKMAMMMPGRLVEDGGARLLGEELGLGHRGELELRVVLDRLADLVAGLGPGRPELDRRDDAFAFRVFCFRSLRSTQTSLSAAPPPAVNRPTTRYDSLGLIWKRRAEVRPLEPAGTCSG